MKVNTFGAKNTFFVLGRYPLLSLAEIRAVLTREATEFVEIFENDQIFIIQAKDLDHVSLQKTLGGTIKIGTIIDDLGEKPNYQDFLNYITSDTLFINYLTDVTDKIHFGISLYAKKHGILSVTEIKTLAQEIKNHLESQGFKARFPMQDAHVLSSATIEKNNVLTKGAEIVIIQTDSTCLIGKTSTVQDFEGYSKRDFGRPLRDMESGIMPPKIARMMINISGAKKDDHLIDPFCGSGTMLQEAALLGFTHVTGIDISKKAVHDSKTNLTWLSKKDETTYIPEVIKGDSTTLSTLLTEKVDAIVCEPYMGPNLKNKRSIHEINAVQEEVMILYKKVWEEFFKVLRPNGNVIMILPVFFVQKRFLTLNLLSFITDLGFTQVPLNNTDRKTIILGNSQDFVLREIMHFRKETDERS